ncbi:MAG: LytTR family DNA-binding domain-containing protein [Bacteroidota bacterium]
MNKIRAILVEDEPTGMDNIRFKLQNQCPEIEIVAECTSGAEAIREINRHLPDVIFLDIMLGDITGFDVLDAIKHPTFDIIFTTSYDEYAIQAIKTSALDYLLKPIDVDELIEAVAKVKVKWMQKHRQAQPPTHTHKIGFPISTGQQFIRLDEIIYAEAMDNVAMLYLIDGKSVRLTKSLGWVEEQLNGQGFGRAHHSYLINFDHIKEYIRNDGGYVIMTNDKAISVSRRRKEEFLNQLKQWDAL